MYGDEFPGSGTAVHCHFCGFYHNVVYSDNKGGRRATRKKMQLIDMKLLDPVGYCQHPSKLERIPVFEHGVMAVGEEGYTEEE